MKIRIGHLSTFYHTAILLMADRDLEAKLGVEVDWRLMGTGPAIMQAFRQRELDLAYIGLPPAIIGMDQGVPVICIAGGHVEGTVLAGKPGWKRSPGVPDLGDVLRQFRGRKIGVPGRGSIHDVILKERLEHYGLNGEVEVANFSWADLVTEAVVHGQVAAAVGTPALAAAIMRYAGGTVLYPAAHLWPDNPSYGIVADTAFLTKEPALVERFLRLHEEATAFLRLRPRDAARTIADQVAVVDEQLVLDALLISPKYCAKLNDAYVSSTMKFVPVLKKLGYIRADIAQDAIFFRQLIDKVHPGRDHYGDGVDLKGT